MKQPNHHTPHICPQLYIKARCIEVMNYESGSPELQKVFRNLEESEDYERQLQKSYKDSAIVEIFDRMQLTEYSN